MKILLFTLIFLVCSCSTSKKVADNSNVPSIDKRTMRYVIGSNLHNFKGCYNRLGKNKRQFVKLRFLIDHKGNVFDPKVHSNTKTTALERCIQTILEGISFPKPKKGKAIGKQSITFVPPLRRT